MTKIVPTVTVAVTPIGPGKSLTPTELVGLAREVGIGIRSLEDILEPYKVSRSAYEKLKKNETFNKLVDAARIEWHSAPNTMIRTQLEALAAAEQALPHLYARAISGKDPLNHAVEAVKWMTDVAGLRKTPTQGQQNERFQITINLGADTTIEFDGSRVPVDGTNQPVPIALPFVDDKEERV